MKFDIKTTQNIIEQMNEGILIIDDSNKINCANTRAKEIMGVVLNNEKRHPAGSIKPGDIVIICDNALGDDDGGMTPDDLKCINVRDPNISKSDLFIGVGVYKREAIQPQYKYFHNSSLAVNLNLNTNYWGFDISANINLADSNMTIKINEQEFHMSFFTSVGNIVIIDGETGIIKFYQDRGYTIRKESLKEILNGKVYAEKKSGNNSMDITGARFSDIVEDDVLANIITKVLSRNSEPVVDQFFEINKRLMLCSISPVKIGGNIDGAILKIEDASSLEELIDYRNYVLEQIEKRQVKQIDFQSWNKGDPFPGFSGNSKTIREVKYLAERAAKSKVNVLITGDSGTGKSKLADEIHHAYSQDSPFVEVNCASIPQSLFESELFGYVGGAFTGALEKGRQGYFEMADGGTLFLDEIGEIPIETQVKLLQALQKKKIFRLGSAKPIDVDVRVIAATNIDLSEAVKSGKFRQDLYYRLNVFPISIPPLQDRKSDIYVMANSILKRICIDHHINTKQLSAASLRKILRYDWPGNVRELENILERAVTLCDGHIILPEYINILNEESEYNDPESMTLKKILESKTKQTIEETLLECGGNKARAMEILNISKSTFYEHLNKYGLK